MPKIKINRNSHLYLASDDGSEIRVFYTNRGEPYDDLVRFDFTHEELYTSFELSSRETDRLIETLAELRGYTLSR